MDSCIEDYPPRKNWSKKADKHKEAVSSSFVVLVSSSHEFHVEMYGMEVNLIPRNLADNSVY